MSALANLRDKIIEWAVLGALVGVIGYLIGNNDATTLKAEVNVLRAENVRQEAAIAAHDAKIENLAPRVLTLEVQDVERMKGAHK